MRQTAVTSVSPAKSFLPKLYIVIVLFTLFLHNWLFKYFLHPGIPAVSLGSIVIIEGCGFNYIPNSAHRLSNLAFSLSLTAFDISFMQ